MKILSVIFVTLLAISLFGESAKIVNSHKDPKYGAPIEFSKIEGSKGSMSLQIKNGKLYALENRGLSVYDISKPTEPKKLGWIGGMGGVRQLKLRGNTAFLSSRQCGLWAVDISDPTNLKIISQFDAIEMATGLDVAGDFAFIGNRVFGVQCIDIANPAKMKHVSSIVTSESQSVFFKNGFLYSGDWGAGEITVIDYAAPAKPSVISKVKLDGYGDGMDIVGDFLYASTGQHKKSGPKNLRFGAGHGLEIFDISDRANPQRISRVEFPSIYFGPCDYWTPRVCGNYCFASDTVNGVFLIDISDKRNPKIIGNLILPKCAPDNPNLKIPYKQILDPNIPQGDAVSSIAIGDGVLYISGNFTGIYIAEFPKIAKIPVKENIGVPQKKYDAKFAAVEGFDSIGADLSNPCRSVAVRGDLAYAALSHNGVGIYALSENKLREVGKIPSVHALDAKVSDNRLVVAEAEGGIGIYDISDAPTASQIASLKSQYEPKLLGRIPASEFFLPFVQTVWAFDGCNIICASIGATSVNFFDISNPSKYGKLPPVRSGGQLLYNDYGSRHLAAGKYFELNYHCGGRMIFDMSGKKPKIVFYDDYPICSQTGSVAAFGDKFITMARGGYAIDDPAKPVKNEELADRRFPRGEPIKIVEKGSSKIARAMFPQGPAEGLAMYDEGSKRLAVSNRIYSNLRIYDFSDAENPQCQKMLKLPSNAGTPDFYKGHVVLPCGYAGLMLEK